MRECFGHIFTKLKLILFLCVLISFTLPVTTYAQVLNLDSLLNLERTEKNDTMWVKTMNRLSRQYRIKGDSLKALSYADAALKKALAIKYKAGEATAYANKASIYDFLGNYPKTLEYYNQSLRIFRFNNDSLKIASVLGNIGYSYFNMGDYNKSVTINLDALKIFQAIKDSSGISNTFNTIGNIFLSSKDLKSALKYFRLALDLAEKSKQTTAISTALTNIGVVSLENKDYNTALKYFRRALTLRKKGNQLPFMALCYNNIGKAWGYSGNKDSSEYYFLKSFEIRKKQGDKWGMCYASLYLAEVYTDKGDTYKALFYARQLLKYSKEINAKERERDAYNQLNAIFLKTEQIDSAYYYLTRFFNLKEKLMNSDMKNEIARKEMKFGFDKRETELLSETKQKATELKDQKIISYIFLFAGSLILIFLGMAIKANVAKNKANKLVNIQKNEIEEKKNQVEEKQKEIIDSIRYAKRIQSALLPSEKYFEKNITRMRNPEK